MRKFPLALCLLVAACAANKPTAAPSRIGASATEPPASGSPTIDVATIDPSTAGAVTAAPAAAGAGAATTAPTASAAASSAEDKLGPLALGMAEKAVEKAIGPAEKKTAPDSEEGATGDWVWSWEYPTKGLSLTMAGSSKAAPTVLRSIQASVPSKLRTTRGIGLGSAAAEVKTAYGKEVNPEESNDERIVVGSVFGGIIFDIKAGKVTGIFLGAAAE